mgnify:CR=1 FL=1
MSYGADIVYTFELAGSYVARILHSEGRLVEAETELRASLARSTSPPREHAVLALVLLDQERAEEALTEANAESSDWAKLWSLGIVVAVGTVIGIAGGIPRLHHLFADDRMNTKVGRLSGGGAAFQRHWPPESSIDRSPAGC